MDEDHRITITICGDGGCGKSSITLRLVRSEWNHEYDPTIEDSYSVTRTIDGQHYLLMLTDTAGQEEYRGLWASSNLNSDAFLLVYDITAPHSLEALNLYMEMIDMEDDTRIDRGAVPPVKMVVGNKCDLKSQRMIASATGLDWARSHGCGFMETSAREMVNIEETFGQLVRRVVETRRVARSGGLSTAYKVRETLEAGNRTKALPPPRKELEKDGPSSKFERDASDDEERESMWKRMKCW